LDRIPSLHRHNKKLELSPLVGGIIESFTTVRHPPEGFGTESYTVALIKRDDGKKVMAQLTHESATAMIGARVTPHMRRILTMKNGLHVNDIKYHVVASVPAPTFTVTSYVLAVSGPSGVGKTTVARSLLSLMHAVTEQVPIYTTRKLRKKEIEPYVYVKQEEFQAMINRGEIISHTHMQSSTEMRLYGYRRKDIENIWSQGKLPIVVTEIHLLQGLVNTLGRRAVLSCGLLPPGKSKRTMLSALLHRLRARDNNTEEQIQERLKVAKADLKAFDDHAHLFDHIVVNDELDLCLKTIGDLVRVA
jgi:guanylate kinase